MYEYSPLTGESNTQVVSGIWTYFTVVFAFFAANVNTMTSILGLVLLVIRLVYELPKAIAALQKMCVKKDKLE